MQRITSLLKILAILILLISVLPQNTALARPFQAALADIGLDSSLSLYPNWATEGNDTGVEYGIAVASAGDINNDGFDDVIVGAQRYLVEGQRSGSAFIFLGGPSGLSESVHEQITPTEKGSFFGGSVSCAGDVNGDGIDDVIIGAPHHHVEQEYEGAAYVYYGSNDGIRTTPAWTKIGSVGNGQFGYSVQGVGDVNNDGYDDVLIGSLTYSLGQENEGAVYLFLGSIAGLGSSPAWMMESDQASAQMGYDLAALGDLNHDHYDDFAFSAPGFQNGEDDEGKVWVVYGASDVSSLSPAWTAEGNQEGARFGSSLDGAGDVDGNNYKDLIVGADKYDSGQENNGAAFLFYNSNGVLAETAGWFDTTSQAYSGFGVSVAGIGDFNEDGYDDIAIGAHKYSEDQSEEGFVFIYRGSAAGAEGSPAWDASGNKAETEFGYAVAGAGYVDNDNKADIVIGAPTYKKDEKTVMGRAFVYLGLDGSQVFGNQVFLPMLQVSP